MKIDKVVVGGRYTAKVSGIMTIVRVLGIRKVYQGVPGRSLREAHRIDVVNERTGRRTTFRSAAKLRALAIGDSAAAQSKPRATLPAFDERDCSGVFDGNQVVSDADPGL